MKSRPAVIFITLLSIAFLADAQSEYQTRYSGAYYILVSGYSSKGESEAYTLKADGSAAWVYGNKDSSGKVQTQQKYGTWKAERGLINVTIRGNTGDISETYQFKDGRFVNKENPSRYLKKI